jgi:hypothetical protein
MLHAKHRYQVLCCGCAGLNPEPATIMVNQTYTVSQLFSATCSAQYFSARNTAHARSVKMGPGWAQHASPTLDVTSQYTHARPAVHPVKYVACCRTSAPQLASAASAAWTAHSAPCCNLLHYQRGNCHKRAVTAHTLYAASAAAANASAHSGCTNPTLAVRQGYAAAAASCAAVEVA